MNLRQRHAIATGAVVACVGVIWTFGLFDDHNPTTTPHGWLAARVRSIPSIVRGGVRPPREKRATAVDAGAPNPDLEAREPYLRDDDVRG